MSKALEVVKENENDWALIKDETGKEVVATIEIRGKQEKLTRRQVKIAETASRKKNEILDREVNGYNRDVLRTPTMLLEVLEPLIVEHISALVTNAFAFCNFATPEIKDLKYMIRSITLMVMTRYTYLEFVEVALAVGNGLQGDYGEFFGISALTFSKFFKGYVSSGDHTAYLNSNPKFGALPAAPKYKLLTTSEGMTEIDQTMQDGVIASYKNYLETKIVKDLGSAKYLWLKKLGIIKPTSDEIKKHFRVAREQYKEELAGYYRDASDRKKARKLLADFNNIPNTNGFITAYAENNALACWFDKVRKDERSLEIRFTHFWNSRKTTKTKQPNEENIHPILRQQGESRGFHAGIITI